MNLPKSHSALRSGAILVLCTAAILFLMSSGFVWGASFKVSPTRFEFKLDKRFTDFFTISNTSDSSIRIRAYTGFLDVTEDNQLSLVENHPLDLSKYVVINPRNFPLSPGQSRIVRFSVRPPPDLEPGEHRVVIFFDELPGISGTKSSKPVDAPQGIASLRIELLTRLGITMYGMKGKPLAKAELEESTVTVEGGRILVNGKVVNRGNVHVSVAIDASVKDADGARVDSRQTRIVVQRAQWRAFQVALPIPQSGAYTVSLTGKEDGAVYFESQFPVTVVRSP